MPGAVPEDQKLPARDLLHLDLLPMAVVLMHLPVRYTLAFTLGV